jgi:AraC-like DNA-binding protein/tetratricopeptide (TPR) repeat protein
MILSDDGPSDGPSISPRPLPRGVRRTLDAMCANLEHRWTLGELAAIAGVSVRTLQRQFASFLGKPPQAILRDLGFARARSELLQGGPDDKVMDVASRCGFAHYGRFAADYRRRYGETPSQTLKRQALLMPKAMDAGAILRPMRDRLILAVDAIDAGEAHAELAADIGDDLVAALIRSGLGVTAGARTARYRMQGAIRGEGSAARLTLRLIDTESDRVLWAHRTDGVLRSDADHHERLAGRVAAAVQPHLRRAEIEHALDKPDQNLTARDLALRAMPGVLALDAKGNMQALDILHRALDLDPDHGLSGALAAWAHAQRVVYHFGSDFGFDRARGLELAQRVQTRTADAMVLSILGNTLTLLDHLPGAEALIRKALSTDGSAAWAWSRSGWLDVYHGDPTSAVERFRIALDLAPQDVLAFNSMVGIGCAHFAAGNYLDAARWQQRALVEHPSASWVHRTMCPAYVLAGAKAEAARSLQALRSAYPELTLSEVRRGMPPLPDPSLDLIFEALSDAGLPA